MNLNDFVNSNNNKVSKNVHLKRTPGICKYLLISFDRIFGAIQVSLGYDIHIKIDEQKSLSILSIIYECPFPPTHLAHKLLLHLYLVSCDLIYLVRFDLCLSRVFIFYPCDFFLQGPLQPTGAHRLGQGVTLQSCVTLIWSRIHSFT